MNRASRRQNRKVRVKKIINLTGEKYLLPTLQETEESNLKCYGKSLNSCSGSISREHFISAGVLRKIGKISSAGIPWLSHLKRNLSVNDLTANCLCAGHNSFLSPLDLLAGEAFEAFRRFGTVFDEDVVIHGPSFERLLLKVFIGLFGTRQISDQRGRVGINEIPEHWIKILFGKEEFPSEVGLYSANLPGDAIRPGLGFELLNLEGVLKGMRAKFGGLEFILAMEPKEKAFSKSHPKYNEILYRPKKFDYPDRRSSISFYWPKH